MKQPLFGALFWALVGLGFCVAGAMESDGESALILYVVGLPLLGLGTYVARCRRGPPMAAPLDGVVTGEFIRTNTFYQTAIVLCAVPFAVFGCALANPGTTDGTVGLIIVALTFALPLCLAGLILFHDQRLMTRFTAALLGPSLQGELVDGSLSIRSVQKLTESTGTEYVNDPTTNRVERRTTHSSSTGYTTTASVSGTPGLSQGDGTVPIATKGAWVATTRTSFSGGGGTMSGGHRTSSSSSSTKRTGTHYGYVHKDDRVLVVGQRTDEGLVDVRLIVGDGGDGNPRFLLVRQLVVHAFTVCALGALSLLGWALQWSHWPG